MNLPFHTDIKLILDLLLPLTILTAIICVALLARERGRSWFRWFLLSLLITPFLSLPALFLFSRLKSNQSPFKTKPEIDNSPKNPKSREASKTDEKPIPEPVKSKLDQMADVLAETQKKRAQAKQDEMDAGQEQRRYHELTVRAKAEADATEKHIQQTALIKDETAKLSEGLARELEALQKSAVMLEQELGRLSAIRDELARQGAQRDEFLKKQEELRLQIEKTDEDVRILREELVEKNMILLKEPLLEMVSEPSAKSKLRWY